ncbi:DUF2975 domain-containing protein [Cupriavidus malaysiensis]|uniref:DUF2975 domain-containing protein n=1 Tax=Cupriavidus malaysiensis TaxID=367825 RepID=A0ABM6FCA1_9BURK|nr:DUF2975 domain-containing protein [Cupriavidus malaysiensis]AOZ09388.1 hypothetical protein BKK80_26790 [Cupriavidus malaysiensis]
MNRFPLLTASTDGAALSRVQAISRWLRWLAPAASALTLAFLPAFWLGLSAAALSPAVRGFLGDLGPQYALRLDLPFRVAGLAVSALAATALLTALWQAGRLSTAFARGEIFTLAGAMRLRRIALAVAAFGAALPLTRTLLALLLVDNGQQPFWLVLVYLGDGLLWLLSGLLLAIAWAQVEATRIARENAAFI